MHQPWLLSTWINQSGQQKLFTADRDRPPARTTSVAPTFLLFSTPLRRSRSDGPAVVYLLVNTDGEDIPVLQRLLTKHQPMVELLDWLVAPGGSVRVRQADQLSAPRMQLRRHLQWAASIPDSSDLRQ